MTRTRRQFLASLAGTAAAGPLVTGQAGGVRGREIPDSHRAAGVANSTQTASDWRMFGANPANSGYQPGATGPQTEVGPAWAFETNGTISAGPTVVEGTVYVGSQDGHVYAIAAEEGTERWRFDTGSGIRTTPAVVDGAAFVGTEGGLVYAIDTDTGDELWRFGTSDAVRSSPSVVDGTVYVGSRDSAIYAIDAADGTERWRYETQTWTESSPAVADGVVYSADDSGTVYALDAAEGTEVWTLQLGTRISASPAVADGTVYIGGLDGRLYTMTAAEGDPMWSFNTEGAVAAAPAVRDGVVYVSSRRNFVYAIDGEDGEVRWQFDTGLTVSAAPAVTDELVYVASESQIVYGLGIDDGTSTWEFEAGLPFAAAPAISDGAVFVGGKDQTLYRLDEGFASAATPESGDEDPDAASGESDGTSLRFLSLPAAVATLGTLLAGGYYALNRAGFFDPIETASETYGDETAASDGDSASEASTAGDATEAQTADTDSASTAEAADADETDTPADDEHGSDTSQIWKLAIAEVLERSTETETTATDDVIVTKHLDHETLSSPVLVYEIESVRDDPTTVRITEPILGAADEDSRPMGDSWHVEDDTLVYESVLAPGETATTLVGRPDCPTADADRLLEAPDVTVESV